LLVIDARKNEQVGMLKGHAGDIRHIEFLDNGKRVMASGDKGTTIFDANTMEVLENLLIKNCVGTIQEGRSALTRRGELYDLVSGRKLWGLKTQAFWSSCLSRNGRSAAVGSGADRFMVWDVESAKPIQVIHGPAEYLEISEDGRKALSCSRSPKEVCVWDAETGKLLRKLQFERDTSNGRNESPGDFAFSDNGRHALSLDKLWDLESGQIVRDLTGVNGTLQFSPDDQRLLHMSWALRRVGLQGLFTGESVWAHDFSDLISARFFPDGKTVLVGSKDGLTLLDASTGSNIDQFNVLWKEDESFRSIDALSDNGWVLLSGTISSGYG
jgi:WD40 repeat protein